jgi:hypothetical protein
MESRNGPAALAAERRDARTDEGRSIQGEGPMKRSDYAVTAAAVISLATSIYLWFGGHRDEGVFVGLWVPSILSFATYFRLSTARK